MKNMNATPEINLQNVSTEPAVPNAETLTDWALVALHHQCKRGELTIRIVDPVESQMLNQRYRQQNKPTNVLAFPFASFPGIDISDPIIGDIVICAAIVNQEAKQQGKPHDAHWAHIVIHGILHLLGYDHLNATDAQCMETLEIDLLQQLGYANPYEAH